MQNFNNSISFKNNPTNKNHFSKFIKKSNNNNIITKVKDKEKKNSTSILRNALLKKALEKFDENNKKTKLNKNNNKYLRKEFQSNDFNGNINNMSNMSNKKIKANNVTNNICIIIKTSENQKQNNLKNSDYNFEYIDSINNKNNSRNQSPSRTENDNFNLKSNNFKNKKLGHNKFGKIKLKSQNNSFVINKHHNRTQNNSITKSNNSKKKIKLNLKSKKVKSKLHKYGDNYKKNNIKSKQDSFLTQNNSQKYKKRILIPKIKNSNFGHYKNDSGYSKEKYFTEAYEKNIEKGSDNIICSPINSNRNIIGLNYKDLIQQKKKLLGINLNIKEKKKEDEIFINYDKEREEIEEKIKLDDEKLKNERKIISYKNKEIPRRILSGQMSQDSNLCNFYLDSKKNDDKLNDSSKNIDNIINNDNYISKSEISYIQTESNKDEIKKYINLIKPGNNYMTNYSSQKSKKKINIKYKKRNINKKQKKISNNNNRNSFNSINNINNNRNSINSINSINRLSKNSSGLLNSKSCIDIFIKESKMNRNISIILKDIKKIINRNKSIENKEANKIQKKPHSKAPKNEILMVQDNEDGKTLHCIKKLSKDKIQEEIQIKTINSEKNTEESPKKITEILFNIKKKYKIKSKKHENKSLEIKIPGEELLALRRIKSKIHDYKKKTINKNKNKLRNSEYVKIKKYKSFSYFCLVKSNYNKYINVYKMKRSNSLKVEYKNEQPIFNKLKFY